MEQSGITSAKVSDFDTSNVSVMGFDSGDAKTAEEYWNKYSEDFTAGFGEIKYEEEGTDTTLCGVPAKKYIYTVNVGGIDVLGLGTDFDGIGGTQEIADSSMLPQLWDAFAKAGFHESEIEKIAYGNVMRVIKESMK